MATKYILKLQSYLILIFVHYTLIIQIECKHQENPTMTSNEIPKIIYESKNARIWHLQDNNSFLPSKVYLYFKLMKLMKRTISPSDGALSCVFEQLIIYSQNKSLLDPIDKNSSTSPEIDGADFLTLHSGSGYVLKFVDTNESKVHNSIINTFQSILSIPKNQYQFQPAKNACMMQVGQAKNETPLELAAKLSTYLQSPFEWTDDELFTSLQSIDLEQIERFKQEFFTNLGIEIFAYGKIDSQSAINMLNDVQTVIQTRFIIQPVFLQELILPLTIDLPPAGRFLYSITITTAMEKSAAAVCLMFQTVSLNNIWHVSLNEFTIYLIKALLFHSKLASIFVRSTQFNSIEFFAEDLQSTPNNIDLKLEEAIKAVEMQIISMPVENFQLYKNTFAKSISNKSDSMDDIAFKFWKEIRDEQYCFNKDHEMQAAISNITKADLITYYQQMLDSNSKERKKFAIYIYSSGSHSNETIPINQIRSRGENKETNKIYVITNIKPQKNGLPMVLIPKIRSGILPLGIDETKYHLN